MTTPRLGHNPIVMRHVPKPGELDRPGDFRWSVNDKGERTLVLLIPQRNENFCYSRWTINHQNAGGHSWMWDSNIDRPTLSPSLHAIGIWHGWVRDGHLVEA